MTDGVWRLSDHPELRPLMTSGQIQDVILVSIGYPNTYNYDVIRKRDLQTNPDSFLHFIVDNLIPYLEEIYSVNPENMTLTGHSLGGYWAYYALLQIIILAVLPCGQILTANSCLRTKKNITTEHRL